MDKAYESMSLIELSKEPGIRNLQPLRARAYFAQALQAEARGQLDKAEELLNKAIETVAYDNQ